MAGERIKLYSYWRSSAAYRVRIALNLKGLAYELLPVSLINNGGEHRSDEYRALNAARQSSDADRRRAHHPAVDGDRG